MIRTTQQNKAMHVLFRIMSQSLNENGFDVRMVVNESVEIPWTPYQVKELLWRKVQMAMFNKQSTTDLTAKEVIEVYETVNRHISTKVGLHVPFPSIEEILATKDLGRFK